MAKYANLTLGEIEAVVNKLGGMDGVEKFLQEDVVLSYLDGRRVWEVWMSIEIGHFTKPEEISLALASGRFDFESAESLLNESFPIFPRRREVCLVLVSFKDLGLDSSAKWHDVLERAQKLGLCVCPPEVGPQLRLQYIEQEAGEVLFIGMHGLVDSHDDSYHIFNVWADAEKKHLDTVDPLNEIGMYDDGVFVFVLHPNGKIE